MDTSSRFDAPCSYQIRLRGQLASAWTDWFDGFTLSYQAGDTLLSGRVPDQAALHGLLAKIRDLGLPIVSITSTLL